MNDTIILLSIILAALPMLGFAVTGYLSLRWKYSYVIELFFISVVLILSFIVGYYKLFVYPDITITGEFTWFSLSIGSIDQFLPINLGITIDNLTALMLIVVAVVSSAVHFYSVAYMHGDSMFNKYFAYLGLFSFSMFGIVLTHNLLMMYIFWELVGLSSYLLIGFWFYKDSAADASKKAFLANRVGDVGMFLGILITFITYKTFTFESIFNQISNGVLPFNSEFWLTILGILLFCGAIGKSAQFPLHVWLPDAMEGPTPVSALIHAATMVAAGVYLTARIFPLLTADALYFVAIIGLLSMLVGGTIALFQNDIKKVLAYSTISQLGYMIMAIGIGAYAFGMMHLVTHAFFKAGLFLGAGSVIYAMHHEQNIKNMGGLRKLMPITYVSFIIYTIAIAGVPLTSGFLSKDGILNAALSYAHFKGDYLFVIGGFGVAFLTALYMFRLVILVFHGNRKEKEHHHDEHDNNEHSHEHHEPKESPAWITFPLIILALLSVFIFYSYSPLDAHKGNMLNSWIVAPLQVVPENSSEEFLANKTVTSKEHQTNVSEFNEIVHHNHYVTVGISLAVGGFGILLSFLIFQWKKVPSNLARRYLKPLHTLLLNKYYFDELYSAAVVNTLLIISKFINWIDATIVDGIVNASAWLTKLISRIINVIDIFIVDGLVNLTANLTGLFGMITRKIQSGKVQAYLVMAVFSVILILFFFLT